MPKMKHRNGGRTIDVSPSQVSLYEGQGWRVVKTPAKKTAASPKK